MWPSDSKPMLTTWTNKNNFFLVFYVDILSITEQTFLIVYNKSYEWLSMVKYGYV